MRRKREIEYDFIGGVVIGTSPAAGSPWVITDTSAAGTPTYAVNSPSSGGEFQMAFSSTNEVQNLCLSHNDKLSFDIDDIESVIWRVKMGQALLNAASSVFFGIGSARNDTIDTIASQASFRLIGADSVIYLETDDGVNDVDDYSSGQSLSSTYKDLVISFAEEKRKPRFFVDGIPVGTGRTFDMTNYTGSFQPMVQLQKTASTATDGIFLKSCRLVFREAA